MSSARFIVGDCMEVLRSMPDQSVQSVITSPPYLNLRSYLPEGHPEKHAEIGQEDTPGDFIEALLTLTDELYRVVREDGTMWINLGDTAAFSGGSGGDYNPGGLREGQATYEGTARKATNAKRWNRDKTGWPLPKSVCWVPQLFGASLAYGRNLLTGTVHRQWITRQEIVWCKPNPPVGELIDKFRPASERIVLAAKNNRYYFDLDSVREPHKDPSTVTEGVTYYGSSERGVGNQTKSQVGGEARKIKSNPIGAPPLDWWTVSGSRYAGAHFATYPPELIKRPVIASCPPGGVILDPFGGSGTTAVVALGHGRDCILIDIDERNAQLAQERVGMFLTVERLEDAA